MSRPPKVVRTWRAPLVLAAVSALGLTSALLADGAGDVLAWLTLATPVVVVAWCALPNVQRRYFREPVESSPASEGFQRNAPAAPSGCRDLRRN